MQLLPARVAGVATQPLLQRQLLRPAGLRALPGTRGGRGEEDGVPHAVPHAQGGGRRAQEAQIGRGGRCRRCPGPSAAAERPPKRSTLKELWLKKGFNLSTADAHESCGDSDFDLW